MFYPLSKGIRIINKCSIYTRNHKLIFERKNFEPYYRNMCWDGKSNNQLLGQILMFTLLKPLVIMENQLLKMAL